MPADSEVAHILNLNGGLNLVDPPAEIQDSELLQADNMWYLDGKLCKRPGFKKLNSSNLGASGLFILGYDPNTARHVIGQRNGNLLKFIDTSDGTVGTATGTITDQSRWLVHVAGTTYIGFKDTMGVRILSGSAIAASAIVNSPVGSAMAVYHKGRIFSDVFATRGRIAFSDPISPTAPIATWQTTNIINLNVENLDLITGFASLGDLLLIFFTNSVWVLYVQGTSPADWVARKISNGLGAAPSVAGAGVCVYGNEVFFISKNGVYKTNSSSFVNLATKIWDPLSGISALNYAIATNGHWRITVWNGNLVVVGVTGFGTYNYIYNIALSAWTSWNFDPIGGGTKFEDAFGELNVGGNIPGLMTLQGERAYFVTDSDVSNYDSALSGGVNTFTDGLLIATNGAGAAYTAQFKTKEFQTELDRFIRCKWVGLEYKAYASPIFSWFRDNVPVSSFTPGFNSTRCKGYKIPGTGRCRSFALTGLSSANSPWELDRIALHIVGKPKVKAVSNA